MRTTMTSLRKGLLAVALVTPLLLALPSNVSAEALKITTSSDPADLVSGGGALLRVDARAHVPTNDFVMDVNGPNVTGAFPADQSVRTLADLGTNLQREPKRPKPDRPGPKITIGCALPIGLTKPGYNLDETALLSKGWVKEFEDNFNCPPLDLNKWTYWTGGAYNNELQYYQLANLNIINGDLQIKAMEERVGGFDYTSGRIESIKELGYVNSPSTSKKVRIYARIKLPSDYGLWPAFWTLGYDPDGSDDWPTNGEIDILEAKVDVAGQVPRQYQVNYIYGYNEDDGIPPSENLVTTGEFQVTNVDLMDGNYHVFHVEWSPYELKFYFDNVLKKTQQQSSGYWIVFLWDKSQRIVLNLAYGGDFVTASAIPPFVPGPITDGIMKVDWVKVFVK